MANQFHFHGTVFSYVRIGNTMSNVVAYIGPDNAPMDQNVQLLYAIVDSYSACVNQPVQRLFFALSAILNHRLYGVDVCDAYAHSLGTYSAPTFVSIDDQYAEWYHNRYKNLPVLDCKLVLPVQKAIQGHPEDGRMWETHINSILFSPELNF